jgi:hypothetical protein
MPSERHKRIPLSQPINPGSYGGPSQESRRRKDEDHDHGFVFQGVALYATTVSIHPPRNGGGLGEGVRKHVVKTSSSLAFLHIGRL